MANSEAYVFRFLDFLATQPIARILLPDTLGVLTPEKTRSISNYNYPTLSRSPF